MNFGPGTQEKLEESIPLNDSLKHAMPVIWRKKPTEDIEGKENAPYSSSSSSMERKRIQYSVLAQSVGMEEVEFSKWLLSATPSERENMLIDYKKRKEKTSNAIERLL